MWPSADNNDAAVANSPERPERSRLAKLCWPSPKRQFRPPFVDEPQRRYFYRRFFVMHAMQIIVCANVLGIVMSQKEIQKYLYRESTKGQTGVCFLAVNLVLFGVSCSRVCTDTRPWNALVPLAFPPMWAYLLGEYAVLRGTKTALVVSVLVILAITVVLAWISLLTRLEPVDVEYLGLYGFLFVSVFVLVVSMTLFRRQTRVEIIASVWGLFTYWVMLFYCLKKFLVVHSDSVVSMGCLTNWNRRVNPDDYIMAIVRTSLALSVAALSVDTCLRGYEGFY